MSSMSCALERRTWNRLPYFSLNPWQYKGLISRTKTSLDSGSFSINCAVKHPVPGPNSTTYFILDKSRPSNIRALARALLGTALAFCLGFLRNSTKKDMSRSLLVTQDAEKVSQKQSTDLVKTTIDTPDSSDPSMTQGAHSTRPLHPFSGCTMGAEHLQIISLNVQHASVEDIGWLHVPIEQQPNVLSKWIKELELEGMVFLTTCNRVEFIMSDEKYFCTGRTSQLLGHFQLPHPLKIKFFNRSRRFEEKMPCDISCG